MAAELGRVGAGKAHRIGVVRAIVKRSDVLAAGVFDQLDAFIPLGAGPLITEELLDLLGSGRTADDQHRIGLIRGEAELIELVALDGLDIAQVALGDLRRLLGLAQGLEFLLLTQVDQLGALVELVMIRLEMLLLLPASSASPRNRLW